MTLNTPDWLTSRGGAVKLGSDSQTYYVVLQQQPQYALKALPVKGEFGCTIVQTNNGKSITSAATAATREAALQLGLSELRKTLGW